MSPRRRPSGSGGLAAVLLPALTGYLVLRVVVLLVALRGRPSDPDVAQGLLDPVLTPDGRVLGAVAADGYGSVVRTAGGAAWSDTALFPAGPALARLAAVVSDARLVPATLEEVSLALAFVASVLAAAALCVLTRAVYGDRAAVTTTWLWALLPPAASVWTPAPYALLAALSVGALAAWTAERPLLAAGLAGAAGLSDPAGLGAVAAVLTGTALLVRHREVERGPALGAVALAAGPPVAYAAWLADRRGSADAVLTVLASRARTDTGTRRVREQLLELLGSPPTALLLVALGAALAVGLVLAVADRQPVELVVHGAVTVLVAGLTAPSVGALGALALAAVAVWMPLGDALAARPRTHQAVVLGLLALASSAWTSSALPGSPLA